MKIGLCSLHHRFPISHEESSASCVILNARTDWPVQVADTPRNISGGPSSSTLSATFTRTCISMPLPVDPDLNDSGLRLVSVIIPARNEARGIAAVIRSVQAQRISGWSLEVVVVDDGSEDDTAAVAQHAGARVLVLG